jgi:hypothetical protein
MSDRPTNQGKNQTGQEPLQMADTGGSKGGRGRQGVGEAFLMSMIRQIARSIGAAIVRAFVGRRR